VGKYRVTDRNGKKLDEGNRVWFQRRGTDLWLAGTVRNITAVGDTGWIIEVDDGDPTIADPRKNRMKVRAKVDEHEVELWSPNRPGAMLPAEKEEAKTLVVGVLSAFAEKLESTPNPSEGEGASLVTHAEERIGVRPPAAKPIPAPRWTPRRVAPVSKRYTSMTILLALLACSPAPAPVKPVVEPMQAQPGVTCYVANVGGQIVGFSCVGVPQPPLPPQPPVAGEAAATATATATDAAKADAPKAEEKKAE
jgi:hypothetical protein